MWHVWRPHDVCLVGGLGGGADPVDPCGLCQIQVVGILLSHQYRASGFDVERVSD